MKKYMVLMLLALGLIQVDCKAVEDEKKSPEKGRCLAVSEKMEEVSKYFEDEKENNQHLKKISEEIDFHEFALGVLEKYPNSNASSIMADYIRHGIQHIVWSEEYQVSQYMEGVSEKKKLRKITLTDIVENLGYYPSINTCLRTNPGARDLEKYNFLRSLIKPKKSIKKDKTLGKSLKHGLKEKIRTRRKLLLKK